MKRRKVWLRVVTTTILIVACQSTGLPDVDNIRPTANYDNGRTSCIANGIPALAEYCLQDNYSVVAYVNDVSSTGLRNAILATLDDLEASDLAVSVTNNPEYAAHNNAETDIIYRIDNNMNIAAGLAFCEDEDDGNRCDQHYVIFDQGEYCAGLSPANCADPDQIQRITCHETGHTVGLTHGDDASPSAGLLDTRLGCLKTPIGSGQNYLAVPRFLEQMNKRNINHAY